MLWSGTNNKNLPVRIEVKLAKNLRDAELMEYAGTAS